MKKIISISVFVLLLVFSKSIVRAQNNRGANSADKSPTEAVAIKHRIIFQLTTSDTMVHKALMKQLSNIKSVAPTTEIEVVCHGPGLDILLADKTKVRAKIKLATEMGVEFKACEFSIKERGIDRNLIIPESGFVPAGIIEIVTKQELGWSYIKS